MSLSEIFRNKFLFDNIDPRLKKSFSDADENSKFLLANEFYQFHFSHLELNKDYKDNESSGLFRKNGNELYKDSLYWDALQQYNLSIAYALSESPQLCYALGNRALCLIQINYLKEALQDIESALAICTSNSFKEKLLKRRKYCEAKLNGDCLPAVASFGSGKTPQLSREPSLFLDSASQIVEMSFDNHWGRKLIVNNDVKVGEILMIEKPYSSLVLPKYFYTHCSKCFKRSLNLIPCNKCVTAMFCDQHCQESANHATECSYLSILHKLKVGTKEFLALKVLVIAAKEGQELEKLYEQITNPRKKEHQKLYRSDDFINIYDLVTNYEKRNSSDLFNRALTSAVLISILEKHTDFFKYAEEKRRSSLKIFCGCLIFRLLQSLPCNAHAVSECFSSSEVLEIGAGAYATFSLINHSCDPNVVRYSFKDYLVLKAIKPMSKGDQLFDCYGEHYAVHNFEERQRSLLEQYYFKCECEPCVHKWPTYIQLTIKSTDIHHLYNMSDLEKQFEEDMLEVTKGNYSDEIVERNIQYLHYMHDTVQLPWANYNRCQELIKECWNFRYNYFRLLK